MPKRKWILAVVAAVLIVAISALYAINNNQNNNTQWQGSLTVPQGWELVSENTGGGDVIDSPQKTVSRTYKVPGTMATALQEFGSSLTAANYSGVTADVAGCESSNPTPSCYVSGSNEVVSVRASKSIEDMNSVVVVVTKQ